MTKKIHGKVWYPLCIFIHNRSVFDPFVDSPERAEKKESKEKISKKDQMKENKKYEKKYFFFSWIHHYTVLFRMVNDFIKSWNSSTHVEPFRSYMEKDGSVLYFIAVDNGESIGVIQYANKITVLQISTFVMSHRDISMGRI